MGKNKINAAYSDSDSFTYNPERNPDLDLARLRRGNFQHPLVMGCTGTFFPKTAVEARTCIR